MSHEHAALGDSPKLAGYFSLGWTAAIIVFPLLTMALMMAAQANIEPSWLRRLGGGLAASLFIAPAAILAVSLPVGTACYGLARWRKWKVATFWWASCSAAVTATLSLAILPDTSTVESRLKACTTLDLRPGVNVLGEAQGVGFGDQRHLWLIEGSPEDFESMFAQSRWLEMSSAEREYRTFSRSFPVDQILLFLGDEVTLPTRGWVPEGHSSASGHGWVFANRERSRWAIWWNG